MPEQDIWTVFPEEPAQERRDRELWEAASMSCSGQRIHMMVWLGDEIEELKFAVARLLAQSDDHGPIRDKLEVWAKRLPDIQIAELPAAERRLREMEDDVRSGVYEDPFEAMEYLNEGLGRMRGIGRALRTLRRQMSDLSG